MLIQIVHWLQNRESYLAMLCKSSVSRKLLTYLHQNKLNLSYCATYRIDARKYFDANVEACLLFCKFDATSQQYFCDVFSNLEDSNYYQIGYRNDVLIRDVDSFDKLSQLYDTSNKTRWRSGIKHDCSSVMEFRSLGKTKHSPENYQQSAFLMNWGCLALLSWGRCNRPDS
jgi:hypothetical protein